MCVWRLATPLWPLCPTLSSMGTRESWLSLWKQTTPSLSQKRYAHQNSKHPIRQLVVNRKVIPNAFSSQVKTYLADPSAFAAVAAPAAAAETAAAPAAAKEEAKEESEESDDDMGFGLFD